MIKPRSNKKLLKLLLTRIQKNKQVERGLCFEILCMFDQDELTYTEYDNVYWYISNNRPTKGKHYDEVQKASAYFWEAGLIEPRITWLKYMISPIKIL